MRKQISGNVLSWTATGQLFLTFELVLAVSKANKERILPLSFVVSSGDCCFQSCEDTERSFVLITREHVIFCVSQLQDKGSRVGIGCIND